MHSTIVPSTRSNVARPVNGKSAVSNLPPITQALAPKEDAIIIALLQQLNEAGC